MLSSGCIATADRDMKLWHTCTKYTHVDEVLWDVCLCVFKLATGLRASDSIALTCAPALPLSFYLRAFLFLRKYLCLTANLSLFISARRRTAIMRGLRMKRIELQQYRDAYKCCRSLMLRTSAALSNWKFNLCSRAEICPSQHFSFVFIKKDTVAHLACSHGRQKV